MMRKAVSHQRLPSNRKYLSQEQGTIFGNFGVTHKPGFSHISKDLPRNNGNFVKNGLKAKPAKMSRQASNNALH